MFHLQQCVTGVYLRLLQISSLMLCCCVKFLLTETQIQTHVVTTHRRLTERRSSRNVGGTSACGWSLANVFLRTSTERCFLQAEQLHNEVLQHVILHRTFYCNTTYYFHLTLTCNVYVFLEIRRADVWKLLSFCAGNKMFLCLIHILQVCVCVCVCGRCISVNKQMCCVCLCAYK